jgi:cyclase
VDAGRVVKGVNFRDLRDAGDPVELAAAYDADGADELVFLDITASSAAARPCTRWWAAPPAGVHPLTVGGGVRSVADVDRLLRAGRGQGLAEHRRHRPAGAARGGGHRFGSQCVVLSVDARRAAGRRTRRRAGSR